MLRFQTGITTYWINCSILWPDCLHSAAPHELKGCRWHRRYLKHDSNAAKIIDQMRDTYREVSNFQIVKSHNSISTNDPPPLILTISKDIFWNACNPVSNN